MKDEFVVLGMNGNLFLSVTSLTMCIVEMLLSLNGFNHGSLYGIADFIFAVWFGFLSFAKWNDYRRKRK